MSDIDQEEEDGMGFSGLVPSLREKQEERELDKLRSRVKELEGLASCANAIRYNTAIMRAFNMSSEAVISFEEIADTIERVTKKGEP